MSGIKVNVSSSGIERAKEELSATPRKVDSAVKDALHRVGAGLKTDAVDETKQRYHLLPSDIRKHMHYKKITGVNSAATLIVRGPRRDISEYKVTGSGKNLRVSVKKGHGGKPLRTGFLSNQIKDNAGKPVVLWRPMGSGQDPVKRVKTLSIPQAVGNKETVATMKENARGRFEKRLDQNITRLIKGTWSGKLAKGGWKG